jgi:hypothetical protein
MMSQCESCYRKHRREWHGKRSERSKEKDRVSSRTLKRKQRRQAGKPEVGARVTTDKRPATVDRVPFANWLRQQIDVYGVDYTAKRIGMSERRMFAIINGYAVQTRPKRYRGRMRKRKLRPIDFIDLATVDKALAEWADPRVLNQLYPAHAHHIE